MKPYIFSYYVGNSSPYFPLQMFRIHIIPIIHHFMPFHYLSLLSLSLFIFTKWFDHYNRTHTM